MSNGLNKSQQSIYDFMKLTLQSWGLGSMAHYLMNWAQQGMSSNEIQLRLQDTPEWKQRFAGNEIRQKQGLSVLNPAQYLAMEDGYRQVLRQYGIPAGFYDNKAATDKWIGGDVSASELQTRVAAASDLVNSNPSALQTWSKYYGGGKGGAIAAILDTKTALPVLQQQVTAAQIGGAAADQGLQVGRARATTFAQEGVSLAQARQAYSQIASRLPVDQSIASRFGTTFGQGQEENATLLGSGADLNKQASLYAMEGAQFSGHGAASQASNDAGGQY